MNTRSTGIPSISVLPRTGKLSLRLPELLVCVWRLGVNGYGILTVIGTCLNHLKYPVTHNLISYRDYHQSLLLHMHSHLGGIVHAFLYVSIVLNSY